MVGSGCIPIVTNVSTRVNRGHLLAGYLVFVEKTAGVECVFEGLCMCNIASRCPTVDMHCRAEDERVESAGLSDRAATERRKAARRGMGTSWGTMDL